MALDNDTKDLHFGKREIEYNKEAFITRLEQMQAFLDEDKVSLLLTYIGMKPAMFTEHIRSLEGGEFEKVEWEKERAEISQFLKQAGLPFIQEVTEVDEDGYQYAIFIIGKDKEGLKKLEEARRIQTMDRRDIAMGRVLGYPESAIQAFVKGKSLIRVPEEIQQDEGYKFLGFRLSKENWQQELEVGRKNAQAIKRLAPHFYQRVMQQDR